MLQYEFLSRQQRRYARAKKNRLGFYRAQLDRFMHRLTLVTIAFMLGLMAGEISDRLSGDHFDLNKCDYLYPRDALERVPLNWKEIDQTPEGNWCVTLNQ